ncbi:MAG: isocitrate/isopropylmalate dehydrogenase family protein [Caldilineaceae bacterium]|nr:isocitrate/isopropylmalate dehydrogenase family protein [Caldilineaceae bacterium]MBP8108327.1 isocitrate/isopropylmalate dehydrogenase family protein [Caldilineaceae bacterium]MBP8122517.1 isocitrate/isopropylmalate dehydrogenase family protein [Caldilineaceae bacterium]MBP9072970.1 isocitrate/isopropylmalate dehydrogenase family protein [Caldilineaceae bacterium]
MNPPARTYRIALIPGDGIGQEVVPAARRVLTATGLSFDFVDLDAGWATFQQTGTALPPETLTALRTCDGAIFGAVSSPSHKVPGYSSPIVAMRNALDLYANLRPIVSAPVAGSRPGIDMLIVRENTECLYVKRERLSEDGNTAIAERVITRGASERIARMAFEQAQKRQKAKGKGQKAKGERGLVTIVHKANVLSVTDGLFREAALAVAAEFPDVEVEEQLVDSMLYRMIREPARYDVVVAPNLYGDILSDGGAALVGGLGLVPSANVGDHFVLVEPVHGSAPDIAGRGMANPMATLRAAALLLAHLGQPDIAAHIENAVNQALILGFHTPDLGGKATTDEVTASVVKLLTEGLGD